VPVVIEGLSGEAVDAEHTDDLAIPQHFNGVVTVERFGFSGDFRAGQIGIEIFLSVFERQPIIF